MIFNGLLLVPLVCTAARDSVACVLLLKCPARALDRRIKLIDPLMVKARPYETELSVRKDSRCKKIKRDVTGENGMELPW